MPSRVFIDTSFVIALINTNDQFYDHAQSLSYQFEAVQLLTTDAVLLEIGNALARRFRNEAIEIIQLFREGKNVEVVPIDDSLFEKGLELNRKFHDKKWGLVDCISFVVMQEQSVNMVLTFDYDFEQAGFIILDSPK